MVKNWSYLRNHASPNSNGLSTEQESPEEKRKLTGRSILDYSERQIDHSQNLLANRWLSRRCGAFIVAPSGHGKSSLAIQCAILWSCGRVAFAIKPAAALRVLIVQSEDDDNDVTEMAQMVNALELTDSDKELVRKNTHVEWLNDVSGKAFFRALSDILEQFPADLVIINPFTAYQGGELKDDELNNSFLRTDLNRLMAEFSFGSLIFHHTPKTNFQNTDDYSWWDWMYSMAGGAALTNWARGVLAITPTDVPGTYRFIAAKRFEKTGWQEREYYFAHCLDKILWVPANSEQIASAKDARALTPEELLPHIPLVDAIERDLFFHFCKQRFGLGENKVRRFINILESQSKIFFWVLPRRTPRAQPPTGYSRSIQTSDDDSTA